MQVQMRGEINHLLAILANLGTNNQDFRESSSIHCHHPREIPMPKTIFRCLLGTLLITILTGGAVQAQDPTGYAQVLNQAKQTLDKSLNLTPDQKPKADQIMRNAVTQRLVVFTQYGVKRWQRPSISTLLAIRSKMTAISSDAYAQMAHVLNPQQLQTFTAQTEKSGEQIKSMLLGK
jgi:hypothetical protein